LDDDEGFEPTIEFLGINTDGTAGVLPPGYRNSVTFEFQESGADELQFQLLHLNGNIEIDWDTIKQELRPEFVADDEWDAIFGNLITQVGTHLPDLEATLADNATYLSSLGVYTRDANDLLEFEVFQADVFGAISQRYFLGPFGRGSTLAFDVRARVLSDGDVLIESGGLVRRFLQQPDGSYQGGVGDYGTLARRGDGTIQILETDGTVLEFLANGRLDYTENASGRRITIGYTGDLLTSVTDSELGETTYEYNGQGRVIRQVEPTGIETTFTYDPAGEHLMSLTSPLGTGEFTYVSGRGPAVEHAIESMTLPGV
jgi:YD repeat-containing protein